MRGCRATGLARIWLAISASGSWGRVAFLLVFVHDIHHRAVRLGKHHLARFEAFLALAQKTELRVLTLKLSSCFVKPLSL
ncbi:hypothetical protein B0T14DRAFT_21096 [Immersiella caudata]|uniref:Uncharacterized protein n=1 Tax=Immersiella caudata TaxID=314043 RepID=A0AA39XDT3_9PEZI|nr:hypothetical protein B0T14DRAFT_21096 [Immersiella caudata]